LNATRMRPTSGAAAIPRIAASPGLIYAWLVQEPSDFLEKASRRVLHRVVASRDHDHLALLQNFAKRLARPYRDDVVGVAVHEKRRALDACEPSEVRTPIGKLTAHRPEEALSRPLDPVDLPHSPRIERPLIGPIGPVLASRED